MGNKAVVPKEKLKQIIKEEAERSQRLPSNAMIEDLLQEANQNLKFVQSRLPGLVGRARAAGQPARLIRDDLHALNEALIELAAIIAACEPGE